MPGEIAAFRPLPRVLTKGAPGVECRQPGADALLQLEEVMFDRIDCERVHVPSHFRAGVMNAAQAARFSQASLYVR